MEVHLKRGFKRTLLWEKRPPHEDLMVHDTVFVPFRGMPLLFPLRLIGERKRRRRRSSRGGGVALVLTWQEISFTSCWRSRSGLGSGIYQGLLRPALLSYLLVLKSSSSSSSHPSFSSMMRIEVGAFPPPPYSGPIETTPPRCCCWTSFSCG